MKHPFSICLYGMTSVLAAALIGEPIALVIAALLLILALNLGF